MKKMLIVLFILLIILVGFSALNSYIYKEKQGIITLPTSYKDATYIVEGDLVTLKDGLSEVPITSGSATTITTSYFGNEVFTDLNNDGREDIVFLITQDPGGTGFFYYVVAALNTENGYVGSSALLLGDRIAPQTTEKGDNGIVIVNYADRKPGEPFSAQPSIGKSIWLKLDPETMQFGEVVQNFEGEADPQKMSLGMKKWEWVRALYNDGKVITPKNSQVFSITFGNDGKFSVTTDCNAVGGRYTANGNKLMFSEMVSTKKYCEGSQESDFIKLLENTASFHFTSRGELIFELKLDSGTITFR